jgi:alpha-glucosidase
MNPFRFIVYRLSFILLLASPSFAQYSFLGNADRIESTTSGALVHCDDGNSLEIRFLLPQMFRVTLTRPNYTDPLLNYPIAKTDWAPVALTSSSIDTAFVLKSSALELIIHKNPCRLIVCDLSGKILCEDDPAMGIGFDGPEVRCWKTITPDEKFFGLGLKSGDVNKRGREWTMWNTDYPAYDHRTDPLYESIPFFVGLRGGSAYGIYFNNSYRSTFNMGAGNRRYYSFAADQGNLDYFFISGPAIPEVVERYTELTGRMSMPPEWALGYQQCRWSYFPESRVMELARTFRNKQIPCDVIYLDIHHMDGYRVFTWDRNRFPQPETMLANLKKDGFRVVTIIDPGVKADSNYVMAKEGLSGNRFVKYPDGTNYIGEVWPGPSYFPDFSDPKTRLWWGEQNARWIDGGVSGIWNDMNEPACWGQAFPTETIFQGDGHAASQKKFHNLYGFLMARATKEGIKKAHPMDRPFILTRAAFAGIQRYSAVWTGDNVSKWDHLDLGIRMMQGLGLSGIPFNGTDIGGFMESPTPELYARWIEVGALSPLCRTHTEYNSPDQEPWSFGDDVERISRDFISLRYRLLPYFYSLFYESTQTGTPLLRPLFWNDQTDEHCFWYEFQHQFFVGDKLLAAPVTRANERLKKVYLPKGKWLDWNSDSVYTGPATIMVDAPLDKLPMFLREGAIIPQRDVQQRTGEQPLNKLTLDVFAGSVADSFRLYEDDGISHGYEKGDYRLTQWTCRKAGSTVDISQSRPYNQFTTSARTIQLRVHGLLTAPRSIAINGKAGKILSKGDGASNVGEIEALSANQIPVYYDARQHITTFDFPDQPSWKVTIR